jgi:serine phosphatase RsbU (regulator of sigma subunit)
MYSYNLKISKKLSAELDERNCLLELQGAELKIQHEELIEQKTEIEAQHLITIEQKNQIELHSKAITDSIRYAQKIQSAILPPESYLRELLHEYFILNRPKNIVSGDFYWIKQAKGHIILVAADCTGHGVPGAFMSLLGISYLNEIAQRSEIIHADQILNELRSQVKRSLRQYGQLDQPKDGMDVAICIINIETKMMQYAGAFNPFYLIREVEGVPELKEIKADSMPVGFFHGKDKSFTKHELQLEMNDTFYIFSDGFADQFGGNDNKKFKIKNFKNLLLEIQGEAMHVQKEILDKTLVEYMKGQDQTDDILVIGVRI